MKRYKQLTGEQRYQISGLRKAGWAQTDIAGIGGSLDGIQQVLWQPQRDGFRGRFQDREDCALHL